MAFEFISVLEYGLERSAEVFTEGFSDYFVKIVGSPALLLHMARVDSVDLAASQVVLVNGTAVGAALLARRGWTSRLAGMAIVPAARRQGAGRALVEFLLRESAARGERAMVLEVIEQNVPAVKLYEVLGFRHVRRLVGFSRAAGTDAIVAAAPGGLREMDPRSVGAKIMAHGRGDLPWQIAGETAALLAPPCRGFQFDGAWAVTGPSAGDPVMIRALAMERGDTCTGAALVQALVAEAPDKEWRMGAFWPEEDADVFLAAGFVRTPLTQWQMVRSLGAR